MEEATHGAGQVGVVELLVVSHGVEAPLGEWVLLGGTSMAT